MQTLAAEVKGDGSAETVVTFWSDLVVRGRRSGPGIISTHAGNRHPDEVREALQVLGIKEVRRGEG
jgi:hypothetical protein